MGRPGGVAAGAWVMRDRADLSLGRNNPHDPPEARTISREVKSLPHMDLAMSGEGGVTSTASA